MTLLITMLDKQKLLRPPASYPASKNGIFFVLDFHYLYAARKACLRITEMTNTINNDLNET